MIRKATQWLLPGRVCPCCGIVTFAEAPPGAHAGSVSYGPVLNATGTPSQPWPAGAAFAATSIRPPPTASAHSTPSAAHWHESPGYRHFPTLA